MLSLALFGTAFAACGLSAVVDPNGKCETDDNTYSTLDADSDDDIPISLEISSKARRLTSTSFICILLVTFLRIWLPKYR